MIAINLSFLSFFLSFFLFSFFFLSLSLSLSLSLFRFIPRGAAATKAPPLDPRLVSAPPPINQSVILICRNDDELVCKWHLKWSSNILCSGDKNYRVNVANILGGTFELIIFIISVFLVNGSHNITFLIASFWTLTCNYRPMVQCNKMQCCIAQ